MAVVSVLSAFVVATATPTITAYGAGPPSSLGVVLSCGLTDHEKMAASRGGGRHALTADERELALCMATPPEVDAGEILDVEGAAWSRRFERLLASIVRSRRRQRQRPKTE